MCISIAGFIFICAFLLLFLTYAIVKKQKHANVKRMEESALKGISTGICERLHAACSGSKWKWVCCPNGFDTNGGIARIEVLFPDGGKQFMDVCFSTRGYMALHVVNAVELKASNIGVTSVDFENLASSQKNPAPLPRTGTKPHDAESVVKWYNIVFINTLTALINDLNAKGEVCIYIGQDGKVYVEEKDSIAVVYDFGEMPDIALWEHITEKLGNEGLFAEVQEENRVFISWA